ncbi:MAG TPA: hypothetical protein VIR38_05730 [Thalassobaculum sp.]
MVRQSRPPPSLAAPTHTTSTLPALTLAALMLGTLPAALPSPAVAQTLCSEPVEPICANTVPATDPNDATDQRVARNRCLDDMENYRTKLDAFRGCLDASVAEATRNLKDTDALIRCLEGERPDCRLDDLRRSR